MAKVLILLAEGCEELEAVTLIDVLRRAEISVITASLTDQTNLICSRSVGLIADTTLDKVMHDDFDMLILPGGQPGTNNLNKDPRIHTLIKRQNQNQKTIAAICAAPLILANAGVLNGKVATCYPGTLTAANWPDITLSNNAIEIDGNIITSQGPGTAMEFALSLIQQLTDQATRHTVETGLFPQN